MDLQTAMRARLVASGPLNTLVAGRVYWGERPQGTALPAVVLQTIDDPIKVHLKGYQAARETFVQADIYAGTYSSALAIARLVIATMEVPATFGGKAFGACFVDRRRDTVETSGTINLHRQSVDFTIWHIGD
jgi:hypothetical protein